MAEATSPVLYFEYFSSTENVEKIIQTYDQVVWQEPAGKPAFDAPGLELSKWLTQYYEGVSPDKAIQFVIRRNYYRIRAGIQDYYQVQAWLIEPATAPEIEKLRSVGCYSEGELSLRIS